MRRRDAATRLTTQGSGPNSDYFRCRFQHSISAEAARKPGESRGTLTGAKTEDETRSRCTYRVSGNVAIRTCSWTLIIRPTRLFSSRIFIRVFISVVFSILPSRVRYLHARRFYRTFASSQNATVSSRGKYSVSLYLIFATLSRGKISKITPRLMRFHCQCAFRKFTRLNFLWSIFREFYSFNCATEITLEC